MGASFSNETKYLFKVLQSWQMLLQNIYAVFEEKSFSEGAFRYCYKGKIKDRDDDFVTTNDFTSGECVVKVYKNSGYTQDYYIDFVGSLYAHEEAVLFNQII